MSRDSGARGRAVKPRESGGNPEPYRVVAHVRGPLLAYDVPAYDAERALQKVMPVMKMELEKYPRMTVEKIEIIMCGDLPF